MADDKREEEKGKLQQPTQSSGKEKPVKQDSYCFDPNPQKRSNLTGNRRCLF